MKLKSQVWKWIRSEEYRPWRRFIRDESAHGPIATAGRPRLTSVMQKETTATKENGIWTSYNGLNCIGSYVKQRLLRADVGNILS